MFENMGNESMFPNVDHKIERRDLRNQFAVIIKDENMALNIEKNEIGYYLLKVSIGEPMNFMRESNKDYLATTGFILLNEDGILVNSDFYASIINGNVIITNAEFNEFLNNNIIPNNCQEYNEKLSLLRELYLKLKERDLVSFEREKQCHLTTDGKPMEIKTSEVDNAIEHFIKSTNEAIAELLPTMLTSFKPEIDYRKKKILVLDILCAKIRNGEIEIEGLDKIAQKKVLLQEKMELYKKSVEELEEIYQSYSDQKKPGSK
jgi:exoribonuclease R